ncbi:MAG TPA: VOC family protein [Gaiellaceae bacterium]|nr:VOC family protein [Gaiellaceae bacterium]
MTILPGSVRPKTLDHVAYWLDDRDRVADFLTSHLGMHVIERTDAFTLVGSDARKGKLTLFAAEGPRERGALEHVALRVNDLDAALAELPEDLIVERQNGTVLFDLGDGIRLGLVEAETDTEFDLDHVALFSRDPQATAERYREYGFDEADPGPTGAPRVEVSGAFVEFHEGDPGDPEKPLLNHLAVLVDSAEEHQAEAEKRDIEVQDFVDAPNTLAVFVWLPERVRLEYVEHKPTFALK